jgi:hypothetical protein
MSLLLLSLLPACSPGDDEGRVVSVVGDQGWEDTSVLDTSGSHGSNVGYTGGADCGDGDTSNDPTGDDVLALDYCSRVTPEGDLPYSGPTNDSGTTSDTDIPPPPGGAPPPCGFSNLVGAFALAGTSASPVVLYCDGDP